MRILLLALLFVRPLLAEAIDALAHPYAIQSNSVSTVLEWNFGALKLLRGISQVNGTGDFVLDQSPKNYSWHGKDQSASWQPIANITNEVRLHRFHGADSPVRSLRLELPSEAKVRQILFHFGPERPRTDPWVLVINSTDDPKLPGHGQEFVPLVRSVPGWAHAAAQQIWVGDCTREFVETEPKPLAIFFSGSFKDWCEVDRRTWRGVEEVLKKSPRPIWASCGGAQALAILSETGTASEWDCPHCRDAAHPKLPIYTHIGHTGKAKCGDYSNCVFERGPHKMRLLQPDPAFAGLGNDFEVMESHCGQIAWAPAGWELIVTAGTGTKTATQCLRRTDAPIYAAQFHIEMAGTPENSRLIMSNFLATAQSWVSSRDETTR